ncbi:hypothetical protein GCK72_010594 [Caenorhabditis remanei]|uniref:Uncharacterized protein n=1 Tax=Caenorhabditis remanei TaxID=31234 RepID=A0A2P4VGT9_CAERE|nr:hypothetical protein GCK72_010594 [Caenorhabditis remanei]KAF1762332.1 hypothetical protein GCK72_010594 [Caenorhabditis remanei]
MNDGELNQILNHFLSKFKEIQIDQSPALLQKLTLSQFKNFAQIDVQTTTSLSEGLEDYLSDHLEILNLQVQLKRKKCELAQKLTKLNTEFNEAIEETNKRNTLLKTGNIDFLNPPRQTEKAVFAIPTESKKQLPLSESSCSTIAMKDHAAHRPTPSMDPVMKPPTYTSLAMSTRKEKKENVPKPESFCLDDSVLNGHEISMINISDERRRLQFDDLDDEDETGETPLKPKIVLPKTPARNPASVPAASERKTVDIYTMPPPPVFTSSSGRVFNQNRD